MKFPAWAVTNFSLLYILATDAYGFVGHVVAAKLLYRVLDKKTKSFLSRMIDGELSEQILVYLSIWPDLVKHKAGMEWAKPLHFYNASDDPPNICELVADLPKPWITLASKEHVSTRQRQLVSFFIHFMVDLHQPLHLTSKLKGGNRVKFYLGLKRTNLHRFWDSSLLKLLTGTKYQEEMFIHSILSYVSRLKATRRQKILDCDISLSDEPRQKRFWIAYYSGTWLKKQPNEAAECIIKWAAKINRHNCQSGIWKDLPCTRWAEQNYVKRARKVIKYLLASCVIRMEYLIQNVFMVQT